MIDDIPTQQFREKIEDAIAAPGGILNPGDTLQTVSDKMVELNTNVLPVSEDGCLVALADHQDPGLDAAAHGHDPKTMLISETMNRDIVFCRPEDDCTEALRKMQERHLSHLPVVNHEMRIVALVTREDLSKRIGEAAANHTDAGNVGASPSSASPAKTLPPKSS